MTNQIGTHGLDSNMYQQYRHYLLNHLAENLEINMGKRNFLVFKNNKYINVQTKNIAFFCVRSELSKIMSFDREEYFVNYSLDQIQYVLSDRQFFRLNRQYLINFDVVKEVEHYFARKLLVVPVISAKEKLLVPREKVSQFLDWLDNR